MVYWYTMKSKQIMTRHSKHRSVNEKSLKIQWKINEQSHPNHQKWVYKISPRCSLGGPWEASGRVLGPSWLQDSFKSQKEFEKWFLGPPLGSQVGVQNRPKIDFKAIIKVIILLIMPFGANLALSWHPKPNQNGAKLVLKSIQVGALIRIQFSEGFFIDVYW